MRLVCPFVAAALMSCTAGAQLSAQVSIGNGGAVGYAAMDEIPVSGGELRLVAPVVLMDAGVPQQAIAFPLKHTAITARVGGMMSIYEVEQTFENPFPDPIEAVYVFPLGDDGAVSGYQITIGERIITGEIKTKQQARDMYEQAKAEGHTAGLVEQNKPNIFTQRIANIAPRERIKVKLTYVELLDYDNGSYQIVVPLTVGPRYLPANGGANPVEARHEGTIPRGGTTSIPYVDASRASSTVSFVAEIDAGVPIVGVSSPSHDIVASPQSPTRTHITLGKANEIPNRDLIVRYQTAGPQTVVGMLTHKTASEGYFVLAIQPKATYRTGDITGREVMIVVDRSGSMDGAPLSQAKAVASAIIDTVTERDTVNVVAFADGVEAMSAEPVRGSPDGKRQALEYLARMQPDGGTEMEAAVAKMLERKPGEDRIRVVYFLTDGFIGNDDVVVSAARRLLGTNRIFTIGIGSAPNRSLLDRLALAGRGFASYLTLTEPAAPLAKELVLKSAHPYLTDVSIDWGGLDVAGFNPANIPDVYAGQPLIVSGRYGKAGNAMVKVSATTAGQRITIPLQVVLPEHNDFEPVASLWARREIENLMSNRELADPEKPVTALGLRFHLVTEFTSFVAIDRSRVVSNGQVRYVEQASIVPEGVNPDTAIGDSSPSYSSSSSYSPSRSSDDGCCHWGSGGPDEESVLVILFAALVMLWLIARRFV